MTSEEPIQMERKDEYKENEENTYESIDNLRQIRGLDYSAKEESQFTSVELGKAQFILDTIAEKEKVLNVNIGLKKYLKRMKIVSVILTISFLLAAITIAVFIMNPKIPIFFKEKFEKENIDDHSSARRNGGKNLLNRVSFIQQGMDDFTLETEPPTDIVSHEKTPTSSLTNLATRETAPLKEEEDTEEEDIKYSSLTNFDDEIPENALEDPLKLAAYEKQHKQEVTLFEKLGKNKEKYLHFKEIQREHNLGIVSPAVFMTEALKLFDSEKKRNIKQRSGSVAWEQVKL